MYLHIRKGMTESKFNLLSKLYVLYAVPKKYPQGCVFVYNFLSLNVSLVLHQIRWKFYVLLLYTHNHYDINSNGTTNAYSNTVKYSIQMHIQMEADSVVQVRTVLLTSEFCSSTRGERHNSYYADLTIWPHKRAAHPRMFKISVGRDPKKKIKKKQLHLQRPKLNFNSMAENSIVCLHGPMSTFHSVVRLQLLNTMVGPQLLNTMVGPQLNLFQNLQNSLPISFGRDVIHTPASFPVWALLWQWWLSYPLCASVKLYPMLCTWTLNPNNSKPNQTEW